MNRQCAQWCGTAVLALAPTLLGAQSSAGASARPTQQSPADTSFAVAPNGVVDITLREGGLVVRGSERTTAQLRTKGAEYRLRLSGAGVTLDAAGSGDRRRGARSSASRRSDDAQIELLVPRGVRLVINGASANVAVSDVTGDVEVHLMSGNATLESLGGRTIVETISGGVSAIDGLGDLRVTTVSGSLVARGIRGAVDVHTTSGIISIGAERARRVQADAVSGNIVFEGSLADDARLQFMSHSGHVALRLPPSAGGELEVSTFAGEVSGSAITLMPSDDAPVRRGRADQMTRRYGFGGGGSARITISTFSGNVTLQRGAGRRSE